MPRGGTDYVPRPDGDFDAFITNYVEALTVWWLNQGFDLNDLTPLTDAANAWQQKYPAHVRANAAAEAATEAKVAARAALEKALRPLSNFVQTYPSTTDADRASIGLTVRDAQRTPSPTPTSRPALTIDVNTRLTHTLRLADAGSAGPGQPTRTRKAKPAGTIGAEVWLKLVDAHTPTPTDPETLKFLTLATKPAVTTSFPVADGGKTAVYMLRWVNTRGEKGPWSEVVTATIAA